MIQKMLDNVICEAVAAYDFDSISDKAPCVVCYETLRSGGQRHSLNLERLLLNTATRARVQHCQGHAR